MAKNIGCIMEWDLCRVGWCGVSEVQLIYRYLNYLMDYYRVRYIVGCKTCSHIWDFISDIPDFTAIFLIFYCPPPQVVSACQGGTMTMWMVDTGQKVKSIHDTHDGSELTTLSQDHSETRLFTGSVDGTVKVLSANSLSFAWDLFDKFCDGLCIAKIYTSKCNCRMNLF